MDWFDGLKQANVNIHVVATGAGAGLQQRLWEIPGSSAYLGGCTFPYAQEEQEELLGFMPEHFCSEEAAVDLASAAYMKAYRFGGKAPVGVGVTASVTSDRDHKGEHRAFICIMTDTGVVLDTIHLEKGTFKPVDTLGNPVPNTPDRASRYQAEMFALRCAQRASDGLRIDNEAVCNLLDVLNVGYFGELRKTFRDASELAKTRFWANPYFSAEGKRYHKFLNINHALMPGAYNPPHDGHFGMADLFEQTYGARVVFAVTTNPPHKAELSVQDCLKRAKLLQGRDRLFTRDDPYYLDKARAFPYVPMLIGADAFQRMFDPKWGVDQDAALAEFQKLGTRFYVSGREVDGKFVSLPDILNTLPSHLQTGWFNITTEMDGRWDISSTELRNQAK